MSSPWTLTIQNKEIQRLYSEHLRQNAINNCFIGLAIVSVKIPVHVYQLFNGVFMVEYKILSSVGQIVVMLFFWLMSRRFKWVIEFLGPVFMLYFCVTLVFLQNKANEYEEAKDTLFTGTTLTTGLAAYVCLFLTDYRVT